MTFLRAAVRRGASRPEQRARETNVFLLDFRWRRRRRDRQRSEQRHRRRTHQPRGDATISESVPSPHRQSGQLPVPLATLSVTLSRVCSSSGTSAGDVTGLADARASVAAVLADASASKHHRQRSQSGISCFRCVWVAFFVVSPLEKCGLQRDECLVLLLLLETRLRACALCVAIALALLAD